MTAAQRLAHERLATRRRRVVRLRRAVLAVGLALFVALFATIYVQMASGDDPALAASSTKVAAATSPSSSADATSAASSDSSQATTSSPAAVTTAQS
jgi:hypothetical protein